VLQQKPGISETRDSWLRRRAAHRGPVPVRVSVFSASVRSAAEGVQFGRPRVRRRSGCVGLERSGLVRWPNAADPRNAGAISVSSSAAASPAAPFVGDAR
jgi:hypothetical protein